MPGLSLQHIATLREHGPADTLPPGEANAAGLGAFADDTGHVEVAYVPASHLRQLCDLAAIGAALSAPPEGHDDPFSATHRRLLALLVLAVPLPCEMLRFAHLGLAAAAIHPGEPTTADLHTGDQLSGLQAAFVALNALITEARTARILGDAVTAPMEAFDG